MQWTLLLLLLVMLWGCASWAPDRDADPSAPHPLLLRAGRWQAHLVSPGGPLEFGLDINADGSSALWNGSERIVVPATTVAAATVVFDLPHYDARIVARMDGAGRLTGSWKKRIGEAQWAQLPFAATHEDRAEAPARARTAAADRFTGRWRVRFSSNDDPAVGIFSVDDSGAVEGTFMTTTGDYRFLAGQVEDGTLRLSCFDGAHAFLFKAIANEDGTLSGDFWSRDVWHETWTAERDAAVELPDAFGQTSWSEAVALSDLSFPDLAGHPTSLADPKFAGKARVLQIFGSWCPNCHDAALYLGELHRRYSSRGLSIVGLAFEVTDDFARNVAIVQRYIERHDTPYPVLIAGPSDKAAATEALRALDRVRSYPTTVFLHSDGRIRAIHTGFTGPATGAAYDALRREFEGIIEELLAED
ncbi:MAG: TlpA disulfide reductase family protein [Planctomycetota bacterium]